MMIRNPSISANNPPGILKQIAPGIVTFFSKRGEVKDSDPYSSFNVCHYTGDIPEHVSQCREQLCRYLNITPERLIIPRQTHSANVAVIDRIPVGNTSIDNTDAIVTTLPDVAIAINTADCVPILLADITAGIVAAVHSGWKGTVQSIVTKAINKMQSLGAEAGSTLAIMGPCICGNCFEVGDEVIERFIANGFLSDDIILRHRNKPRMHIDLPQACRQSLIQAGIPQENISMPLSCSRCNPTDYFSARRLGISSGRTLSLILRHGN